MSEVKTCNNCGREFRNEQDFLRHSDRWRICAREMLWFNCSCHSTLVLLKGKYPWYSPTQFLSENAKSVFNLLANDRAIPKVSTVAMKAVKLLENESVTLKQLSTVVAEEPVMAAKIIKLANDLNHNPDNKIETLEHAFVFIDRDSLKKLFLIASLANGEPQTKVFSPEKFWEHSEATGRLALKVAEHYAPHLSRDQVFISGCLVNIGKYVSAFVYPDKTDEIAAELQKKTNVKPWNKLERSFGLPRHAVLGEIGCALWGLPEFVLDVGCQHHNLNKILTESNRMSLVDLSAVTVQLMHIVNGEDEMANNFILQRFRNLFSLTEQKFSSFVEELVEYHEGKMNLEKSS